MTDFRAVVDEAVAEDAIYFFPKSIIHPDPEQPRVQPDDELAASIKANGIIQAISVRPHPERADEWTIIDGERRWRGAGDDQEIPCRIRLDLEDPLDRLTVQLAANTGKPLTPIDEAKAFKRILDGDPDLSQAELAKKLGIARSTVGDRVRLAELPAVWFDLIASGDLQISHAPLIHPFAKLPAKTHASAVKQLQKSWNWQQREREPIAVQHFKRILAETYKPLLYPLQRSDRSYEPQPEFPVAAHDKECDCGRIRVAIEYSPDARDYCGNPDWWKPRQTEALSKKTEKAAEKAMAKGGRKGEIVIKAKLPAGHAPAIAAHSYETPKGITVLTGRTGAWDTVPEGNYGTPAFGAFDPRDLDLEPAELVPIVDKDNGSMRVGTNATKKVKAAREKFADRLRARQREIVTEYYGKVEDRLAASTVSGDARTLRQILRALVRYNSANDVVMAAAVEGVEIPQNLWDTAFERYKSMNETKVKEWIDGLAQPALCGILSAFVVIKDDGPVESETKLRFLLETASLKMGQEFSKLPVPWIDRPTAKDGGYLVECEECMRLVSENELETVDRFGSPERLCANCRQEEAELDEDENPEGEAQLAEEDLEEELVEA